MDLIRHAESVFNDLELPEILTDLSIEDKLANARWALFAIMRELYEPVRNTFPPMCEDELKKYQQLRERGKAILSSIQFALRKKSNLEFIREHKRIFEVLLGETKTIQEINDALPDIDPELIDRVLGTLQQGEFLFTWEEKRNGEEVLVVRLSAYGYAEFREACSE